MQPTRIIAVAAALALCAPGCRRRTSDAEVGQKTSEVTVECAPLPAGAAPLLKPGTITLMGEIHGTSEAPKIVADLACHASATNKVLIGLELPSDLTAAVQTYLASDGSDGALRALLDHPFWSYRDGRSSRAIVQLIEAARALAGAERPITVFAFDGSFAGEQARDEGMAKNIVAALRKADTAGSVALILTGNLHARTDSERWMGWYVREAFPHARSLDNAYSGGNTWACTMAGCGRMDLTGTDRGAGRFVELHDAPDASGFDGIYYLGAVSASPPATEQTNAATAPGSDAGTAQRDNVELARIYDADQADREVEPEEMDWDAVSARDEQRMTRVTEILAAGEARTSTDYLHAAMIFQHGSTPAHIQRAHELAIEAVRLDDTNETAKWLAAAAKDRYLMQTGKPQLYGTQFQMVKGTWVLYEVDPTVTDEERAKWKVPPLADAQRRAVEMNQRSRD